MLPTMFHSTFPFHAPSISPNHLGYHSPLANPSHPLDSSLISLALWICACLYSVLLCFHLCFLFCIFLHLVFFTCHLSFMNIFTWLESPLWFSCTIFALRRWVGFWFQSHHHCWEIPISLTWLLVCLLRGKVSWGKLMIHDTFLWKLRVYSTLSWLNDTLSVLEQHFLAYVWCFGYVFPMLSAHCFHDFHTMMPHDHLMFFWYFLFLLVWVHYTNFHS